MPLQQVRRMLEDAMEAHGLLQVRAYVRVCVRYAPVVCAVRRDVYAACIYARACVCDSTV